MGRIPDVRIRAKKQQAGKTRSKHSTTRVQSAVGEKKNKKGAWEKLKMAFGDKQKELGFIESSNKEFIKRECNIESADSFAWI